MHPGIQKRLFFGLLGIFALLAPLAIMWSQGYRFDFRPPHGFVRITRTGAIMIKTNLPAALIRIGERPIMQRPGILSYGGTLIKNLVPRTYEVAVDGGENYFPWKKRLDVSPLSVAQATKVLLIPRSPQIATMAEKQSFNAIWMAPSKNALAGLGIKNANIYEILDGSRIKASVLEIHGPKTSTAPSTVEASSGGQNALLFINGEYLLLRTEKATRIDALIQYFGRLLDAAKAPAIIAARWHPSESHILFLATDQGLYRVDVAKNEYARVNRLAIRGLGTGESVYYLSSEPRYTLWRIDEQTKSSPVFALATSAIELLFPKPPRTNELLGIQYIGDGAFLFKNRAGTLMLHDQHGNAEALGTHVSSHNVSPDKKKLAFVDGARLMLKPFTRDLNDVLLPDLDTKIIYAFSELPRQVLWLRTNWHVVAVFDKGIEIVEIDPRSPANASFVPLGNITSFVFDQRQDTLYWLDEKGMLKSWSIE